MTKPVTTRLNFKDSTGLKVLLPETRGDLVIINEYGNLQNFLDLTSPVKVEGNSLMVKDKVSGEWKLVTATDGSGGSSDLLTPPLSNVTGLSATVSGNDIIVKWSDPNDISVTTNEGSLTLTKWKSTKLVYKVGSVPADVNDGTLAVENTVKNQYATNGFTVSGLQKGVVVYFKAFPVDTTDRVVNSNDNVVNGKVNDYTDTSGTPGPTALVGGDATAGFFGEVPNSELITPVALASVIGLTAGISFNEDIPWLKFILDGRILFVIKKSIRHTISWDSIHAVGAAYGNKILTIGGNNYKVRLLKGATVDPFDYSGSPDRDAKGSEWNRLLLPIHIQAKDKSWEQPQYVEDNVPDWNIGYTDEDLLTHRIYGIGSYTWCQEALIEASSDRMIRGYGGVSSTFYNSASSNSSHMRDIHGWRPVLELVDPSDIDDNSGSPGSPILKAGDSTAGFFGEVPNAQFITPVNLASTIGLTAGTSYNTDTPWLKFILDGKILFTTKKPIRHGLSWDQINAAEAVKGTKTVQVSGKTYKVRLLKGSLSDPYSFNASDRGAKGSEWNRLMLPIHIQAKDKSWAYPAYVEDNIPNWNIGYTDDDLLTISTAGNGSYTWCQETPSEYPSYRSFRGYLGVANSGYGASSNTNAYCGWRPVLELVPEEEIDNDLKDTTGSPGPSVLKAGDKTAGFFGEVPNTEFITPANLASTIGLTIGTSYNTGTLWLKFILDGKILFTTKKPIRYNLTWDHINAVGAVNGTKTIQIGSDSYKVRLFKGALTDPYSINVADRGAKGSEWNRLMLPIHAQAKDKSWDYPEFVEDSIPDWGIGYTDADLLTHYNHGHGSYQWCQETPKEYTSSRLTRGYTGVSNSNRNTASTAGTAYGWRPVLELIPEDKIVDTSGSPGSNVTIAANEDKSAGFFGEVPNAQLITPTTLASTINLTAGTSYNTDTPWLKFYLDGKILFTTKKPIRHSISWDSINAVGAAKGTKTIQVSGKTYKVRLFKGALTDPYSYTAADRETKGSEWNRLMLPIHIQAKDKSWAYPANVEDIVPNWNIGYTDADLLTHYNHGNGTYTWCQETPSEYPSSRSIRGYAGVSSSNYNTSSYTSTSSGWRPVLELVQA